MKIVLFTASILLMFSSSAPLPQIGEVFVESLDTLSGNTVDTGEFFESVSVQGRIQMSEYCSNITYSDNNFVNSGLLESKKTVQTDSISVWTEVNSQL